MNQQMMESVRKREVLWKKGSGADEGHQECWGGERAPVVNGDSGEAWLGKCDLHRLLQISIWSQSNGCLREEWSRRGAGERKGTEAGLCLAYLRNISAASVAEVDTRRSKAGGKVRGEHERARSIQSLLGLSSR